MIKVFEFSPTGGTKRAVKLLVDGMAAAGCGEAKIIDMSQTGWEPVEVEADDICVFAVPCFGGRAPSVAVERMHSMSGDGAAAVGLVSFGNRAYDDALLELQDVLTDSGFAFAAGCAAVTEHSIARIYGASRPDSSDASELQAFGGRIAAKLAQGISPVAEDIPGHRPYKEYSGVPIKPRGHKGACARCGACAKACPVGAIPESTPWKTDTDACISCMRCIKACPHVARSVSALKMKIVEGKLSKVASTRKRNELYL